MIPNARAFDGYVMYIDTVLESSAYIQVALPTDGRTGAPSSTNGKVKMAGGDNAELSALDYTDALKALEVFEDKTVPISLFANITEVR